jgi:hypothetical protein
MKDKKILLGLGVGVLAFASIIFISKKIKDKSFTDNDEKTDENTDVLNLNVNTMSAPKSKVSYSNIGVINIDGQKINKKIRYKNFKIGINDNNDLYVETDNGKKFTYKVKTEFNRSDSVYNAGKNTDSKIRLYSIWVNKNGDVKLVSPNREYIFKKDNFIILTQGDAPYSIDYKNRSVYDKITGNYPFLNFYF